MIHRIVITPSRDSNKAPRYNSRGALYDVTYDGRVIVTNAAEPCLAACRSLKEMGITGRLEMWDTVLPYVRLTADIDKAAKLTVREGDRPPAFAKFESFSQRLAKDGDLAARATLAPSNAERPPLEAVAQSAGGAP